MIDSGKPVSVDLDVPLELGDPLKHPLADSDKAVVQVLNSSLDVIEGSFFSLSVVFPDLIEMGISAAGDCLHHSSQAFKVISFYFNLVELVFQDNSLDVELIEPLFDIFVGGGRHHLLWHVPVSKF